MGKFSYDYTAPELPPYMERAAPGRLAKARNKAVLLVLRLVVGLILFLPFMLAGERHAFPKLIQFCARIAKRWPLL